MLIAVHTIHEARIVHSDLKPANFLLVKGALKLIDFGIANALSDDTTNIHRENQVGTLNYISPEALIDTSSSSNSSSSSTGRKVDIKVSRASDIWSLGCILYQMAYGRTPFAGLGLAQKLQCIVNPSHEISFPHLSNDALLSVIQSCLQRDSSKRPTIDGPDGLLNHEFLCPVASSTVESTPMFHPVTCGLIPDKRKVIGAMEVVLQSGVKLPTAEPERTSTLESLADLVCTHIAAGDEDKSKQRLQREIGKMTAPANATPRLMHAQPVRVRRTAVEKTNVQGRQPKRELVEARRNGQALNHLFKKALRN